MSVIGIPWQIPRRLASADPLLLAPAAVLLALSIVMVFSAAIGTHGGIGGGVAVLAKHLVGIVLGLSLGVATACVPLDLWQRASRWLLGLGAALLALILIPGIGHEVNGSTRWLDLGLFNFQPSELIKVLTVLFL
ncbi:MAG: FtsW/RodA/SpoVE family cell cycle protein, partial [Pseudomonadota bacterium]|nr:FtsW/RodA/SpoVE family cell cycle protein [Pseudomonadota bacterium]